MSVETPARPAVRSTEVEAPRDASPPAPPTRGRSARVRRVLLPILAVAVIAAGYLGYTYWWDGQHYVSTDNAQVSGQQVQVGSMNAGRITRVDVKVGQTVKRGQVLATVELPSQVGIAQNGSPKLDFLPDADNLVEVRAPLDGVVIATPGAVGATVAQGQAIVTLVDPSQLYVTANVDETQIPRVKVGQTAEVYVDAMDQTVVGRVDALTPATAASFSLLPQNNNTTTNFTKVTQVVPVRIAVSLGNRPGLLGSSASVRIRVLE